MVHRQAACAQDESDRGLVLGSTYPERAGDPAYGRTINFSDLGTGAHAPLLYVTTDLGLVACEPGTC